MSIQIVSGDLLEANVEYICHQVNCMGKMNSGIAKSIREKWPEVYDFYYKICKNHASNLLLGRIYGIYTGKNTVINMFSQLKYGYDGKKYTSYDAFWDCLIKIKERVPAGSRIGFPYGIGSVRGGASWDVIYTMIKEVLSENFEVYIYRLEDNL